MRKTKLISILIMSLTLAALVIASASFALAKKNATTETIDVVFSSHYGIPDQKDFDPAIKVGNSMQLIRHHTNYGNFEDVTYDSVTYDSDIVGTWTSKTTLIYKWDDVRGQYIQQRITATYKVTVTELDGASVSGTFAMETTAILTTSGYDRTWIMTKGTGDLKGITGSGTYVRYVETSPPPTISIFEGSITQIQVA